MSQWGWSAPSLVNNSHSDFWLGMCPWSQKMGDRSAAVVAFHLCQPYCINARWRLGKKFNVRFSIDNSKVCVGRQLIQCHPNPQSSRFSHLTYFSHIRQRPTLIVLIWRCVCFWALQIHWHTLQTSKHDIKAGMCQNAVKFALILSVQKYVRHSYTSCLQ